MTPTTEAGRKLLDARFPFRGQPFLAGFLWEEIEETEALILDIEGQAAAKERERIKAAVEALDVDGVASRYWRSHYVLAAIEEAPE